MANRQRFINNFDTQFIATVKDVAQTGTPATELDYGILRVTAGAAAALGTLSNGDFYILTAYKRSGAVVTNIEIMKVTEIDTGTINETRLTVERAQEGTVAQSYVPGDYVSLYMTKGGTEGMLQAGANLSDLANAATARTNLGLGSAATMASTAFEAAISAGTTGQYWRGDKSWQTLNAAAVGLGSVENTALSTWAGSANITTVGTVATGTWNATAIADNKIASALTGKTYNGLTLTAAATGFTVAGGTTSKTLTVGNSIGLSGSDGSTLNIGTGGTLGTGAFATIADYLPLAGGTMSGNLTFSGTGRRLLADFSNATLANRCAFQTSTTNGTTAVSAIANGSGAASYFIAFAGSDPANAAYGWLSATTTGVDIYSDKTGTGSVQPIRLLTGGTVRATVGALGGFDMGTGLREARVAMGANDIDCRAGNYFTKTFSAGSVSLTVSNVPASGTAAGFILDATNAGTATITWPSGTKWAGGTAPTLTSSGRDIIGAFTHDGGTTWNFMLLAKDIK